MQSAVLVHARPASWDVHLTTLL